MSHPAEIAAPAAFFRSAAHGGSVFAAIRASITTGICVSQANSWDRVFGSFTEWIFASEQESVHAGESTIAHLLQALLVTTLGVGIIFAIHRLPVVN